MSFFYFPGIKEQLDLNTIIRVSADNSGVYIHLDTGETVESSADYDQVMMAVAAHRVINF